MTATKSASTMEATAPSPAVKDPLVHASDYYCKRLMTSGFFPKINENGVPYTSKGKGRASTKQRVLYDTAAKWENHCKQHFPNGHTHFASPPFGRAMSHKVVRDPSSFFGGGQSLLWTEETAALAAREFEFPENTRVVIIWPDLFERHLLKHHEQYKKVYTEESGAVKSGILTPCPHCGTNQFVKFKDMTGQKNDRTVRKVCLGATKIPILSPVYLCQNPECCGGREDTAANRVSAHSFTLYTDTCFSTYPDEVQECYQDAIHTAVADGKNGQMFVSEELCCQVLHDQTVFSQMADALECEHDRNRRRAIASYVSFVEVQNQNQESFQWPDFRSVCFDDDFKPPGDDKLKDIFDEAYKLIEPYLKRDLFSRLPGKVLRWDATYEFLSKTLNDDEIDDELKALGIVFDDYGRILFWGFGPSEGAVSYQRMHYYLRKRAERAGGMGAVTSVLAGYSDVGCEGMNDPTRHWFQKIWPGALSWPRHDLFHGEKKILDSTEGASHELHAGFARGLSVAALKYEKASQEEVTAQAIREENMPHSVEIAIPLVVEQKKHKKRMYNYIPEKEQHAREVEELWNRVKEKDESLAAAARASNRGYKRYIKTSIPSVRIGTEDHVQNYLQHIRKGCYCDPFPPREMSVPLSDKPAPKLMRLRGTSTGESGNKVVNRLVEDVSRQSPRRAHARLFLRATRYNLDKDVTLCFVTKKKARPIEWYLHMRLLRRHENLAEYQGVEYPPENTDGYDEPL